MHAEAKNTRSWWSKSTANVNVARVCDGSKQNSTCLPCEARNKIVSKHQYPSSARAVYESIGIEQRRSALIVLWRHAQDMFKPQAPTGAPRRPQQFAGHNGCRVSESAKSSNNVETIDRPRTRGASRGASRDDPRLLKLIGHKLPNRRLTDPRWQNNEHHHH